MERAKFAWAMMAAAALCAATATAATVVTSAASDSFRIDTREGPFESTGSETLTYSSRWNGGAGATVTIAQSCATPHTANGPLAAGLADEGEQPWSATYNGEYTLTHATVEGGATGVVETAVFRVTGLGWPQTGVRVAGCTNVYDGAAHTIGVETNGTIAGLTLRYAVGGDASTMRPDGRFVETSPPVFTDVTNVMVFVEASAPLYATTTNSAAVVITKADNAWVTEPSMAGWTVGATPATPNKGQAKFGAASVAYGKAGGAAGALGATRPSAAGSYVATFTVSGTANYGGLVKNVSFTIKAKPKPPKPTPTPKPKTYKVKFSANGGKLAKGKSMAAQTFTTGKAKKLRGNAFTRKGYVFIGWSTRKDGPVAYRNGQSVNNLAAAGKSVTLYAAWAKAQYKVVFDASGGRGKMPRQTFTYGESQNLVRNRFKRKGYVFGGWAIRDPLATIPKIAYKNGQKVKNLSRNGGTVKLYAVWKRR